MKKIVPKMLKGQGALTDPAIIECEKMYNDEYAIWKGEFIYN
jgi:hypothetical protein